MTQNLELLPLVVYPQGVVQISKTYILSYLGGKPRASFPHYYYYFQRTRYKYFDIKYYL